MPVCWCSRRHVIQVCPSAPLCAAGRAARAGWAQALPVPGSLGAAGHQAACGDAGPPRLCASRAAVRGSLPPPPPGCACAFHSRRPLTLSNAHSAATSHCSSCCRCLLAFPLLAGRASCTAGCCAVMTTAFLTACCTLLPAGHRHGLTEGRGEDSLEGIGLLCGTHSCGATETPSAPCSRPPPPAPAPPQVELCTGDLNLLVRTRNEGLAGGDHREAPDRLRCASGGMPGGRASDCMHSVVFCSIRRRCLLRRLRLEREAAAGQQEQVTPPPGPKA